MSKLDSIVSMAGKKCQPYFVKVKMAAVVFLSKENHKYW